MLNLFAKIVPKRVSIPRIFFRNFANHDAVPYLLTVSDDQSLLSCD